MNIIQDAKAISAEFKEIEAEYNSPDSLIDMGNWYYISKKQDEIISRLVDMLEWKPIETAPTDYAEWFILSAFGLAMQARRHGKLKGFITAGDCFVPKDCADSWLPLPPIGDK